ncbi:MAG: quinone-dependent dihydroorotate dehydrogenase [Anaerolineales bacterium]
MSFYESIRPLLFRLDAERAHRLTLGVLALAGGLPPVRSLLTQALKPDASSQPVEVFGLKFANRVGLAAGYDKDGRAMHGLACLGFSHLELGTVTPKPQVGNPRPRVFRLPEDEALINRMGFPNEGLGPLVRRLQRRPKDVVIGVNIGKGAGTPLEAAKGDYLLLLQALYPYVDYLAVNVSSPNTPGLRELQGRTHLGELLQALDAARAELAGRRIPILVKLAPDLSDPQLAEAVQVIGESGMDGIIASNTTTARPALRSPHRDQRGGLSGAPLRQPALRTIRRSCELSGGRLPVIATGGILSAADARAALQAGASLVQLYTGLVYRGPGLVREILEAFEPRGAAVTPALQTQ